MTIVAAVAVAAALSFRVVPLACTPDGLVIAGGGVLRLASQASCAGVVAGRAIAVTLDGALRATPAKLDPADEPASALPAGAFAFAPAAPSGAEGAVVTIVIVVTVPPATPAGSDIYLSTERSGYNPAEIRMDQLDARRYRLQVPLHAGARLAFRVTRGSFSTIERDVKGRLPPPHVVTGVAGRTFTIAIDSWADDQ